MCGICGMFYFDNKGHVEKTDLEKMMRSLVHRGPDDFGMHIEGDGGLGHRRLSIIDLSPLGRQPISNEDRSVYIVYNGEFYNYTDYQNKLKSAGHILKSKTDTEVIVHMYEQYGLDQTLQKINGMFAFCIWDKKRKKVFLVRDRFGIKPLYYYYSNDCLVFASEMKSLYSTEFFSPQVRKEKIPEYFLFNRSIGEETILENVYEVEPGTYVEIGEGKVNKVKYYDVNNVKINTQIAEKEALEEFDRLLGLSIKRRLVSDVPVGVFLSGGIDSSIIAVKTSEIVGGPINTISVAYPESSANEFFWSDQVAEKIGSKHLKYQIDTKDFLTLYPWLTYMYDGPLASVGVGFYQASRLAKENCSVMLCGQGGDEIFGGYSSYLYTKYQTYINRIFSSFLSSSAINQLSKYLPRLGNHKLMTKCCDRLAFDEPKIAASYSGSLSRRDFCNFISNGNDALYLVLLDLYVKTFSKGFGDDFINSLLLADMGIGLQIRLQETDRMTMASSVETRVPFLDHELVEFAFSLPSSLKIKNGVGKYIPKKYLSRHFPSKFIHRKKRGFPTPIYEWVMDKENPIHNIWSQKHKTEIEQTFNIDFIQSFINEAQLGKLGSNHDLFSPLMRFISQKIWVDSIHQLK